VCVCERERLSDIFVFASQTLGKHKKPNIEAKET